MKAKFHIDWKKCLVFLFVSASLYAITSFTMTLGIMLLLIVADFVLADFDDTRKRKREWREFEEELRKDREDQRADETQQKGKDRQ